MVRGGETRHGVGRRALGGLFAFALTFALLVALPATALGLDTASRSAAQIQTRWSQLKPSYVGSPWAVVPGTASPYSTGSLNAGFLTDGLNSVNYARFLAGLPDDVVLDPGFVDGAQHGAVLLAASQFSHTPPKPADMPQAFYDLGFAATSRSNIGWGYGTLSAFNFGCMDDSDSTNIDRLGHRRWILDPPLAKTGMGYAGTMSDTFVFDWSRAAAVDYDSIKWPSEGFFPVEMFATWTAWSVTLNPARYSWSGSHTITLRRVSDGRTWTFTSADVDKGGKYYNFDTGGYGVADCFVFRPDAATLGSYKVGDAFDVTISGGITDKATSQPATISYRTTFMSQAAPPAPDTTPPVTTSDARVVYVHSAAIHLTATDSGSSVAATYWSLDGSATVTGTTASVNTTGTHTLRFWSVDSAGNTETVDAHNTVQFSVLDGPTPVMRAVYRFYNLRTGTHFYTASDAERDSVVANLGAIYHYEGPAYQVDTASADNSTSLYRFYNRRTGTHFYTASEDEKASVIARLSATYQYEGPAYSVCTSSVAGSTAVYRFYNRRTGTHFYTASESERASVQANLGAIYAFEGPAFFLAP
jgi:uncharacterized protein YkwD